MDKVKEQAENLFRKHFTGHDKYLPPDEWDVEVMTNTGKYVSVLVTEEGNRRRGKFIFEYNRGTPLVEYYSGQLGGSWTGVYEINLDSYVFLDGRGAERKTLNLGYKGEVRNIILEDEKVAFKHLYKTGRWTRHRKWHLPLEG